MNARGFSLLLALLAATLRLSANDTALNEGAYGPQPVGGPHGPESVIRMQSEELHIAFGKEWTEVEAKFVFRNTKKDAPAVQLVGFPDIGAAQKESRHHLAKHEMLFAFQMGTKVAGVLQDMRTFVNGAEQKSELRYGWVQKIDGIDTPVEKPDEKSLIMAWHALEVTFPPQQDVTVERRYRTLSGSQVMGTRFFDYTTATGGVWQGTIGRLQADVTLKDGLTVDDLAWPQEKDTDWNKRTEPDRKEWQMISSTQLRLVWKDFEPRTEQKRRGFRVATQVWKRATAPDPQ